MMTIWRLLLVTIAVSLSTITLTSCSTPKKVTHGHSLKELNKLTVEVDHDEVAEASLDKVIESYQAVIAVAEKGSPFYIDAVRRLANLEMEKGEEQFAKEPAAVDPSTPTPPLQEPNFERAISLYKGALALSPQQEENDLVLYQLARAYEQDGDMKQSLRTLDRLVAQYPDTIYFDEAQFRRGELYFTRQKYRKAVAAYGAVLRIGERSQFYERSLYKHGWSLFKREKYKGALDSFFAFFDIKMKRRRSALERAKGENLAEREIIDDTLRVISVSFSYLGGAPALADYFATTQYARYESQIYRQLGSHFLAQSRIQDAADVYSTFIKTHPDHAEAPLFQVSLIEAYKSGGFSAEVLKLKGELVERFGVGTTFWRNINVVQRQRIEPYIRQSTEELARYYHALYQKRKKQQAYQQAIRWYRVFLDSFPKDKLAARMNYLLAEILYDNGKYAQAAIEYDKSAYHYPAHNDTTEAAYSALLSYQYLAQHAPAKQREIRLQEATASALKFADGFPMDKRTPAVLAKAAQDLFASDQTDKAQELAQRVLAYGNRADKEQQRAMWAIVAFAAFERKVYTRAESAYKKVLELTSANHKNRKEWEERLAASIYKQGEFMRGIGAKSAAVDHFLRVAREVPKSPIVATATYDAAITLIDIKNWKRAASVLEQFRRDFRYHPLQKEVPAKLALTYSKLNDTSKAAAEFEAIVSVNSDPEVRREAIWQAAELYEKSNLLSRSVAAYKRYLTLFPKPFDQAMEARNHLVLLYTKTKEENKRRYWLRKIVSAEKAQSSKSTARARYLAANASLTLAKPQYQAFNQVRLVAPLKTNMRLKKKRMKSALDAYSKVSNYGIAEVTTEATYTVGEIYRKFAEELMKSERPKGLNEEELEEYELLLEEQVYPFEEKSIEVHETNAQRTVMAIYDEWIKKSFAVLSKLLPARYNKNEHTEETISAIQ
ncbi:MAG: tetratricopeptide repeat protein [Gammaproteobacteria bacterium]|nr:tetratricopeptide repeat protein [Gammaproteobacteria bacterium]